MAFDLLLGGGEDRGPFLMFALDSEENSVSADLDKLSLAAESVYNYEP